MQVWSKVNGSVMPMPATGPSSPYYYDLNETYWWYSYTDNFFLSADTEDVLTVELSSSSVGVILMVSYQVASFSPGKRKF